MESRLSLCKIGKMGVGSVVGVCIFGTTASEPLRTFLSSTVLEISDVTGFVSLFGTVVCEMPERGGAGGGCLVGGIILGSLLLMEFGGLVIVGVVTRLAGSFGETTDSAWACSKSVRVLLDFDVFSFGTGKIASLSTGVTWVTSFFWELSFLWEWESGCE